MAALKALELDESNAGAHNALADVKKGYDWDLAGAEAEYQRALQLNPSHLLTHWWYAECLTRMGRYDEAIALVAGRLLRGQARLSEIHRSPDARHQHE